MDITSEGVYARLCPVGFPDAGGVCLIAIGGAVEKGNGRCVFSFPVTRGGSAELTHMWRVAPPGSYIWIL